MAKQPTTVRLDPNLYKKVQKEAQKEGLNFSSVVHILLHAFVEGSIQIGVTQYPKEYLETLGKEAEELRNLNRKGQAKTFASSKALFDDILER